MGRYDSKKLSFATETQYCWKRVDMAWGARLSKPMPREGRTLNESLWPNKHT